MKKSKKKTQRSESKYPGLDATVNTKVRKDIMDQDYIDKLTPEQKRMA